MNKLKWGILGAARVNERLLPAIIEAQNSELVAIASRRAGAAKVTLEKYAPNYDGYVACYDDMDLLINDKNIDAIYCPMANEEHAEWAIKAVNAGKHVLIEKPMATTLQDIDAIEVATKKANVKVMEGFMYRFHPQHFRISELVKSGVIGDILSVRSSFSFLMKEARMYRIIAAWQMAAARCGILGLMRFTRCAGVWGWLLARQLSRFPLLHTLN